MHADSVMFMLFLVPFWPVAIFAIRRRSEQDPDWSVPLLGWVSGYAGITLAVFFAVTVIDANPWAVLAWGMAAVVILTGCVYVMWLFVADLLKKERMASEILHEQIDVQKTVSRITIRAMQKMHEVAWLENKFKQS